MDLFVTTLNSLWKVLLIGLLLGAGLPALFAVGVRCLSWGAIHKSGSGAARMSAVVGAVACFVVVLGAIVTGILFVMKNFLAHDFGIHVF